jgi:hypothetical protein
MYTRACKVCKKKFETPHPKYLCCSKKCTMINKVNRRYERENGDWSAYFKHLLSKKEKTDLTPRKLTNILKEQNYRCALSGVPLTCSRTRGSVSMTNASIDRIFAGGVYNRRNVQLVCRAINSFRSDMTVDEFINWSKKVANHAIRKQKKALQKRVQSTKK